jgi:hypothetical protein
MKYRAQPLVDQLQDLAKGFAAQCPHVEPPKALLKKIEGMAERVSKEIHIYLKFYGD